MSPVSTVTDSPWTLARESESSVRARCAGFELLLHCDRTAYWTEHSTLFLADTHFGKGASFRRAGVPVPSGTTHSTLARIDRALERTGANRLLILGDFVHATGDERSETFRIIADWIRSHASLTIELVAGNHDRGSIGYLEEFSIIVRKEPYAFHGLELCHYPDLPLRQDEGVEEALCVKRESSVACLRLAGHVHPAVVLREAADVHRMPAFVLAKSVLTLPAFGDFTGTHVVQREAHMVLLACAGEFLAVV